MKKTVPFKSPSRPVEPANLDGWVSGAAQETPKAQPSAPVVSITPAVAIKRLTLDVPDSLHRRIKTQCAERGVKMADVIREMLEREFPA